MSFKGSTRPLALVTGASLGIGLQLAKQFASNGHDLILVARSEEKLQELAAQLKRDHKTVATVIAMDLTAPEASSELFAKVTQLGAVVDVLVNNAGFGQYGPFAQTDGLVDTRMLQLNMVFLTEATRLFSGPMIAQRRGWILNVASTASFQPGPLMATYYASKAYVLSLSEALGSEFADHGVVVCALCPGPTRSGFQDVAQMHGSRLLQLGMMAAEPVAKAGYQGLMRGQAVIIPGLGNKLLAFSVRFSPRWMVVRLSRYIADRKAA